jgi:hypothetical protein
MEKMSLLRIYLIAILLLAFDVSAISQEPPKAVLVDEFANILCSEDNRAKIDNFFAEISQTPNSLGYVVGSADASVPGRFNKYFKSFQSHVLFRRFDPKRIQFFRGPDTDKMHFRFWIVPEGSQSPDLPPTYRAPKIEQPTLFDSSEIFRIKNNQVNFGDDGGDALEPCDWGLDLNQFAMSLNSDSSLTGYLMASSKDTRDKAKAKTALQLTARDMSKMYGVASHRLKTIYVGSRKDTEMQLWLVPKESALPRFRDNIQR